MIIGQPKTIRLWEGKNCLGGIAYLEYHHNEEFTYIFCDGGSKFISQTCLIGISKELRRFYGRRGKDN